jgi:hypothetical protein
MSTYEKTLSANDTSETNAHMGGILVPKTENGLIALFPKLDPNEYNPSVFINVTGGGQVYKLRFVYYNNKLHGKGTRNEYRLTHLTSFLRCSNAESGDAFRLTRTPSGTYCMEVVKKAGSLHKAPGGAIRLKGWTKVS